jgi:hypothetical protein
MDLLQRRRRLKRRQTAGAPAGNEALAAALGASGEKECQGPGNHPSEPSGDRCCFLGNWVTNYSETTCHRRLDELECDCHISQERFDERISEIIDLHGCCQFDSAYERADAMHPRTDKECQTLCRNDWQRCKELADAISGADDKCDVPRDTANEFFAACQKYTDLSNQVSEEGPDNLNSDKKCDDGSGDDGGGDDGGGGGPYKCGNQKGQGTTDSILEGLFDLADTGMCAIFSDTCQQGGESKSVYCCRQGGQQEMQGLGQENGDTGEDPTCVFKPGPGQPGQPPPGWVPGWMPGGYSSSQYAQALALAALTGVSAFSLIGTLFGSSEGEERAAQPRQQATPRQPGPSSRAAATTVAAA